MIYTEWKYYPELEDCYNIRTKVFIEEQKGTIVEDQDEYDAVADHVVVYENNQPVATGRLVNKEGQFILGRIAVLREYRGKGYGDLVIRLLVRRAFDMGATSVYIYAQHHAIPFYEKLGFKMVGKEFEEVEKQKVEMIRISDVGGNCRK